MTPSISIFKNLLFEYKVPFPYFLHSIITFLSCSSPATTFNRPSSSPPPFKSSAPSRRAYFSTTASPALTLSPISIDYLSNPLECAAMRVLLLCILFHNDKSVRGPQAITTAGKEDDDGSTQRCWGCYQAMPGTRCIYCKKMKVKWQVR